ncbi:unnamed protein product [Thelazia callipaeda]|uniref:Neuropeptide-like protein 32 n=1 Tax=Thelazia callipaeda TaxID=103827 RepID=A0A0N5DB68_THECL|nr:unnamed protein product [Thelazia callipaeda]
MTHFTLIRTLLIVVCLGVCAFFLEVSGGQTGNYRIKRQLRTGGSFDWSAYSKGWNEPTNYIREMGLFRRPRMMMKGRLWSKRVGLDDYYGRFGPPWRQLFGRSFGHRFAGFSLGPISWFQGESFGRGRAFGGGGPFGGRRRFWGGGPWARRRFWRRRFMGMDDGW